MTIANTFASKLAVAFVAIAMLFSLTFAPAANAQSIEDLQAQISALLAQISGLESAVSGGTSAATTGGGSCSHYWGTNLNIGAKGADVLALQKFLNSDPATRVAATGIGSLGQETDYYGGLTGAAVAKYQAKYSAEILAPLGLVSPTTFFGASTRAHANANCAASTPTTGGGTTGGETTGGGTTGGSDPVDSGSVSLSGEGSLGDTNLSQGDDTDIEEGQEDAPVAELELNFENGDVIIKRMDISFVAVGTEDQVWDTLESVSLWVDGDKVAEKDADSKGDYLGDEDNGILRFSNIDVVGEEDEDVTFVIAVTPQVGIDNLSATWNVDALNVRYTDADDVTSTDTITETASSFTIDNEGGDDEITVKTSTSDPDSTTIQVETDTRSGWETIFVFDLDTDDSTNDIVVDGLSVTLTTDDAGGTDDLISDMRLVADGDEYDDWTLAAANTMSAAYVFDLDNELEIDAGDRIPVEVQVRFFQLTGNYAEGTTIQATTTADTIDADGADTLTVSGGMLSGSATGDVHTLRSEGSILELSSTDEEFKENSDTVTTDNEGVFTIKFDVTAFENDLFVTKSAGRGVTSTTTGVSYVIEDGSGTATTTGTVSDSLTSTADTESSQFKVNEGETETFTLKVEYNPDGAGGFYQLQLNGFNFNTTAGTADTEQLALPTEDFETDSLSI